MKLTVTCQTCGKILIVIDKDQVSADDITMYEQNSSCSTVQLDGVTIDGSANIQATMTQD